MALHRQPDAEAGTESDRHLEGEDDDPDLVSGQQRAQAFTYRIIAGA